MADNTHSINRSHDQRNSDTASDVGNADETDADEADADERAKPQTEAEKRRALRQSQVGRAILRLNRELKDHRSGLNGR